jgi:HEAT repeat protein
VSAPVAASLIPFLSHAVADVRIAAATALGESGDKAAALQLEALIRDPDTGVQKAAHRALERLNHPR